MRREPDTDYHDCYEPTNCERCHANHREAGVSLREMAKGCQPCADELHDLIESREYCKPHQDDCDCEDLKGGRSMGITTLPPHFLPKASNQ